MQLDEAGGVLGLEGEVLGGGARRPRQQADDLLDPPALLDEGPGDERGPLGEEVQDVDARTVDQPVVQQCPVRREAAAGVRRGGPQQRGETLGAQGHGLRVVHVERAESVQGAGHGLGHGGPFPGGEGVVRAGGLLGAPHQRADQAAQIVLGQGALLAGEGDEGRDPHRAVGEPGAGAVLAEQPLHQRRERGCGDAQADGSGVHLSERKSHRSGPGRVRQR